VQTAWCSLRSTLNINPSKYDNTACAGCVFTKNYSSQRIHEMFEQSPRDWKPCQSKSIEKACVTFCLSPRHSGVTFSLERFAVSFAKTQRDSLVRRLAPREYGRSSLAGELCQQVLLERRVNTAGLCDRPAGRAGPVGISKPLEDRR